MEDSRKPEGAGAHKWKSPIEGEAPPNEFENPSGIGRGACDVEEVAVEDSGCDHEITAQVEDLVLGETLPGTGIPGYDGEEDGGG